MIHTDKFPDLGLSIFPVMSALAAEYHAINLAQGYPGFPVDPALTDLVKKYMLAGFNQYSPVQGILPLRERLSQKHQDLYNIYYNPKSEVTIFSGATEAVFSTISALINEGDEVIYFEPVFDIYPPAIKLNKGVAVPVKLKLPHFEYDWEEVKSKITSRTKLIILNSPHNPTGKILSEKDTESLSTMLMDTNVLVLSDEVYEHMVFDDNQHISLSSQPFLKERSIVIGSLGKVLHCTGWRIGYSFAPEMLSSAIRKIHQFNTFCANTAIQHAMAEYLADEWSYLHLPAFFQRKRDLFTDNLKFSPFVFHKTKSSYFQIASYSAVSQMSDVEFAKHLTINYGVATIPVSAFYHDSTDSRMLRFCFAKNDSELEEACRRLERIS